MLPLDGCVSLVVAFLCGIAVTIHHGRWSPGAFAVLCVVLAILVSRFVALARRPDDARPAPPPAVAALFAVAIAMPIVGFFDATLIPEPAVHHWVVGRAAQVLALALVASYGPYLRAGREPDWLRHGRFAGLALLVAIAGVAALRADPTPDIDVWTIETRGADVLLEGRNPYRWATVSSTDPEATFTVPYVYPPAALYAGVLGRLIGDVRYANLACILVTGFALRSIARARGDDRPSFVVEAPALFFWLLPPLFFVLDRSWIDPLQVMLIALGVAAHVGGRTTLAAIILGVATSSKQSMFWIAPLAAFALRLRIRDWVVLAVAALVPVAPFLLWDFRALKFATFDFMSALSNRHDGLCFTSFVERAFGLRFPTSLAFLLGAVVVVVASVRRGTDPPTKSVLFAHALTLVYFVFFFFNRWAFANYYFVIAGLALVAAAASIRRTKP